MIDYACFCQIKHLHEQQGLSTSQIAVTLSLDPRTVAYWLTQERFRSREPRTRTSKLDPFKAQMVRMLERSPSSAAQVFQRLRAQGFDGAIPLSKPLYTPSDPGGSPPCSPWPVHQASVLRSIGDRLAPSRWGKHTTGSVSLSWSCATAA